MKNLRRILIAVLSVIMVCSVALSIACGGGGKEPEKTGYSVTFMVEDTQYGEVIKVQKGKRITNKPEDPTFSDPSYVFTGWFTSSDFAENTIWNFTTGIVTSDLTLYAGYRVVSEYVSELKKVAEPVSSKLEWTQAAASEASAYEVKITDKAGATTTLEGSVAFDASSFKVTFTPSSLPQGGEYTVSVKDTTKQAEACVVEDMLLGGAGTQANPFLIGDALDFTAVSKANVATGVYFNLVENITIEAIRTEQSAFTFDGTLIGNGKTITLENSNSAAIYKIGANGYVYNLGIAGKISTSSFDSVGALADYNAGKVEKIRSTANVENTSGTVGSSGLANTLNTALADEGKRGIAGGIVGTNLLGAEVYNCTVNTLSSSSTGTIKANIAGGVIVGLNYGKIEMCVGNGCFGAWNSKETGKSLSNYSYSGAIAGINAGQILKCSVDGSGKVLGQRYESESEAASAQGTNNANLGGIAGYNMQGATISECYFAGTRVHGDENVGGIVGLNAGAISDCYVEGVLQSTNILTYIGGRTNVGGIVGKSEATGSVNNCYSTANVFAYGENAVAYSLAESATNSVYMTANPNAKSLNDNADTNPAAATLIAPTGSNNSAIEVVGGSFDGTTNNMVVASDKLAVINGNSKFFFNETTIKLNFEKEVLPEEKVSVSLYNVDGTLFGTVDVAETGKAIDGPTAKGYKFVGWATELGGAVVFASTMAISLYDVVDYADGTGVIKLYAVMEERQPNEGLIVAVWGRYITNDDVELIRTAYASYIAGLNKSYDIEYRIYTEADGYKAVADFCAKVVSDGDIDVIIGAGSTVNASNGIDYIARTDMLSVAGTSYTGRLAALLTDTDRAIEFFGWMTGRGTGVANVTFVVSGGNTSGELSELLGDSITAPSVTAPEGYEFIGWATTENATEAQITASKVSYSDVKDLLVSGDVSLYPVFAEIVQEPEGDGGDEPATDTTLRISVWTKGGDWVSETELNTVKSGFEAYLTSQGIDVSTLTITYVVTTTSGVTDLGKEVNDDGNFDFIIGCGKNVTSTGGVATIEKQEMATSVFAKGSRYVARLTDNTLAVHLYSYFTSINA